MSPDGLWQASCYAFTYGFYVEAGRVTWAAPLGRHHDLVGKEFFDAIRWLKDWPGMRVNRV